MKAHLYGMCRGNGLAYIAVRFSEPFLTNTLRITVSTSAGTVLPCDWYQLDCEADSNSTEPTIIVVTPLLVSGTLRITIGASSVNNTHSTFKFNVPLERLKWESRLTYRLRKEFASQMRDIESQGDFRRIDIRYAYSIPDNDQLLAYAELSMPYSENSNLQFAAYDECGNPIEVKAIAMNDLRKPLKPNSPIATRELFYSFRLPCLPKGFTIHAIDTSRSDLQGFRSAASNQMNRLRAEGEHLTLDANCDAEYNELFRLHRTTPGIALMQRQVTFSHNAKFSIVVPLFKTPISLFEEMLYSVLNQSYTNWELILVNASPEDKKLQSVVNQAAEKDDRIRYTTLEKNLGITENTNIGIAACTGDFICFLDHDDMIEPDALFEYACALEKKPDTDLFYSDEDKMSEDGLYFYSPYFKTDFDIDLLRSHNYVCHFLCVRKTIIDNIEPPSSVYDGAQDYNLTLRAAEQARNIFHARKVLYHWRAIEESTASDNALDGSVKSYAEEAGYRAISEHLERCNLPATIEPGPVPYSHHVKYLVQNAPLVSIVIPNKDCADLLKACVTSILDKTTYSNYEIVIVENNSTKSETEKCYEELEQLDNRIKIVRWPNEFNFSKIVNYGVNNSKGEYLLLLNNDTEVINPEWLENMLGICQREDVGAVGARLLFADGTVQHAGVMVVDEYTPAHHAFCGLPDSNRGYFNLGALTHQYSAVTAACLLTKRSIYEKVSGFNEELTVAYNDVDFCFKVRKLGLNIVYEPTAKLYHYESVSRGYDGDATDKRIRAKKEIAYLQGHWPEIYMKGDPYLNPNLCSSHYQLKRN